MKVVLLTLVINTATVLAACPEGCYSCGGLYGNECSSCKPGFFLSGGTYCRPCEHPCATCTFLSCNSCKSGFSLVYGQCTAPCKFPCTKCKGWPDFCTECVSGYRLEGSYCIKIPPPVTQPTPLPPSPSVPPPSPNPVIIE